MDNISIRKCSIEVNQPSPLQLILVKQAPDPPMQFILRSKTGSQPSLATCISKAGFQP